MVLLSYEILELIFGQFSEQHKNTINVPLYNGNQRMLATLCLTCKMFRDVAQPLLYTVYLKPDVNYTPRQPSGKYVKEPNLGFRRFLRTILSRKDLATKIKYIQIKAAEPKSSLQRRGVGPAGPDTELTPDILEKLSHANVNESLRDDVQGGYEDAEEALLLSLASNVSYLNIDFGHSSTESYYNTTTENKFHLRTVFQEARLPHGNSNKFSSLRKMSVKSHSRQCIPPDMLAEMVRLPNVEEFSVRGGGWRDNNETTKFPSCPRTTTIQKFKLNDCCFNLSTFSNLIESCSSLSELSIHYARDRPIHSTGLKWSTLIAALGSQRSTLQHLVLSAQNEGVLIDNHNRENSTWDTIGSLRDFTSLRHLSINTCALVGRTRLNDTIANDTSRVSMFGGLRYRSQVDIVDVLPSSLERLTLWEASPSMLLWTLERLLSILPQNFPHFEEIAFDYMSGKRFEPYARGNQDIKERLELLREGLESAGVRWNADGDGYLYVA